MTTETRTPADNKCDATNTRIGWDEWGTRGIPCQARRGLGSFVDARGLRRFFCPATGHLENVERRFGRADVRVVR